MKCAFENCNRQDGHDGPHGFEAEPGLIFAPHGGGERGIMPAEPAAITCDCCGSPMLMQRYENGGARFKCTHQLRECDQDWSFSPDGNASRIVVARMFPSAMKVDSKLYDEFLDYQSAEVAFRARARKLCGLINDEAERKEVADFAVLVTTKRAEIALARPWWKFW